jgi:hypothetical protein
MTERLRCVNGNRRFAWLEHEDDRDGIAFASAMEAMGWKNLVEGLREGRDATGSTVYADDDRGLLVRRMTRQAPSEAGAIWFPDDPDPFTRQWICRPGAVTDPRRTLVFGDEGGAAYLDLLVVSGHGSKGRVYGDTHGRLAGEHPPEERSWNVAGMLADRTTPRGPALKYLILACCTNAGPAVAPMWIPAFADRPGDQVLHGILGYAQMYPGDEVGARIMRRFVDLLFPLAEGGRPPPGEKTILQCWAEANHGLAAWGAVMLAECAKQDRMSAWLSDAGLPDPASLDVRQYDEFTTDFPRPIDDGDGVPLSDAAPSHEARFWVSKRGDAADNLQLVDGTVFVWDGHDSVQAGNNDNFIDPQLGLDPGRAGKLVLSAGAGRFEPGTTMTVVLYLYRETHPDVRLDALLDLRLSPSQRRRFGPLVDANQRKPDLGQRRVDAFNYTFDDGDDEARRELATGRAELFFVVPTAALTAYTDTTTAHSRGYFWLDVVPPRALAGALTDSPPADMPPARAGREAIAAYLRQAIHLVRHGVYLHTGMDDAAEGARAVATLRQRYDDEVSAGLPNA